MVDHDLKSGSEPCHVVNAFNPSTQDAEAGRSVTEIGGHPGLHSETPKQTKVCGESGGGETVSTKLQNSLEGTNQFPL